MAYLTNVNINGLEHYFISSDGKVFNSKNKMGEIKSWPNKNTKYKQVILQNARAGIKPILFSVHRLVAMAYIPNPKNLPEVNHLDRNKNNNDISNLEWITSIDNIKHYYSSVVTFKQKGKKYNSKVNEFLKNKKLLDKGIKQFNINKDLSEITELWNLSIVSVKKIFAINNINWRKNKRN